jgi:hypothetical protein
MFCSNCGTQLPDNANYCLKCGKPQVKGAQASISHVVRWEYKDVDVPVDLRWGSGNPPTKVYDEANKAILQSLQKESSQGWAAEGSTDVRDLLRDNRTNPHYKCTWLGAQSVDAITIRFKRMVQ